MLLRYPKNEFTCTWQLFPSKGDDALTDISTAENTSTEEDQKNSTTSEMPADKKVQWFQTFHNTHTPSSPTLQCHLLGIMRCGTWPVATSERAACSIFISDWARCGADVCRITPLCARARVPSDALTNWVHAQNNGSSTQSYACFLFWVARYSCMLIATQTYNPSLWGKATWEILFFFKAWFSGFKWVESP